MLLSFGQACGQAGSKAQTKSSLYHVKYDRTSNILDPTRKVLVTGSVPTENLPKKSFEVEKSERRPLVRHSPAETSASSSTSVFDIAQQDVLGKLDEKSLAPWVSDRKENGNLELMLWDGVHSIAKYTVNVDTSLEFTVLVFNWPLPDDHGIYCERRRSVRDLGIEELLFAIENSMLCDGLPDDYVTKSVAQDPISDVTHQLPGTVIRHSVPKSKRSSPTHFEVSVNYRSTDCRLTMETANPEEEFCGPCTRVRRSLDRGERRKSRASSTPARSKASLSACGPEKLRATVIETRLQCKTLEANLKDLQGKISKYFIFFIYSF